MVKSSCEPYLSIIMNVAANLKWGEVKKSLQPGNFWNRTWNNKILVLKMSTLNYPKVLWNIKILCNFHFALCTKVVDLHTQIQPRCLIIYEGKKILKKLKRKIQSGFTKKHNLAKNHEIPLVWPFLHLDSYLNVCSYQEFTGLMVKRKSCKLHWAGNDHLEK